MQEFDTEDDVLQAPDELTTLKARADLLGVKYHPSVGVDKLREKIEAKLADTEPEESQAPAKAAESEREFRLRKKQEASELIRVNITCMNPAKKEWEGEIFTAGNSVVGTFKKFVPFNTEDGWHIPRVIYNQLLQRQCQVFFTTKDSRGNSIRKGKLIKEFAIDVLPALTPAELKELAQRQAMARSVD